MLQYRVAHVVAVGVVLALVAQVPAGARQATPNEAFAKMIGIWHLNTKMSVASNGGRRGGGGGEAGGDDSGGGGGRGGRGGRGGGGGGGSADSTPATEAAQNQALRQSATQTPSVLTVGGTPAEVVFTGGGAEHRFTTDGKKQLIQVESVQVNAKTRWDKNKLKQDISVGNLSYTRTWEITSSDQLLITITLNEGTMDDNTKPARFYYDR
jgi:hypothetical protein